MAKRHGNRENNDNYKEVESMSAEENKNVETEETVNNDQKPEGENKPETAEEPKKEGIVKRLWKNKWVRGTLWFVAGAVTAGVGVGIYKHYGSSDVTDALQGIQDKLPEIATATKESVAVIADNHPVDVTVDQVVADQVTTF